MAKQRPLSPHLQVYKPQLTSMMSIMHRITGFALAVGLIVPTWWLVSVTQGPDAFMQFQEFMRGPVGLSLLAGWAFSLIYHLLNGLRHLMWDTGRGLTLPEVYRSGWLVILGSVIVTAALLYSAYN